jgi:hypothetical protein
MKSTKMYHETRVQQTLLIHGFIFRNFAYFWRNYYGNPCALHYRSLACTGLWSNTQEAVCVCLLHSVTRCAWPPGHHFNHFFSQSQVNKPLIRVINVSFPEDIFSPVGDRRGPNLTLEYLVRILLCSPALELSLSQKFFELSCLDCLTLYLYCYWDFLEDS